MAKLFFDDIAELLGIGKPKDYQEPVQADDPLGTSDPQFGYRDYTPVERAQEVVTGGLDTAGSVARGLTKGALELPRDIAVLGTTIAQSQGGGGTGYWSGIQRNEPRGIMDMLQQADKSVPSWLPNEQTIERALPEMTPMSRTYAQDASVYNVPEEIGRFAAPIPLLEVGRLNKIGKLPRILEDGMLTDEAVSALGRIPAGMSVKPVDEPQLTTVYHSTDQEFDQFQNRDIGFHTAATPDLAKRATDLLGRSDAKQIPYQIDTAKYVEVSGQSGQWDAEKLANDLAERGVIPRETADNIINKAYDIEDNIDELVPYWDMQDLKNLQGQMVADELKPFGIEGFKYMNEYDVYGDALRFKGHPEFERMAAEMKAQGIEPDWSYITLDPKGLQRADAPKPTPRILDARDPITGRTGFGTTRKDIPPALEPLREPTRQGGFRTQYEGTNIPIDPNFAEQQLAKTDDELLADLRGRTNHASLVGDLQDKYFQEAPLYKADGNKTLVSDRMKWAYKQAEQELLRNHKAELRDRLLLPSQERSSYIGGKPVPRILEDTPKVEKEPPMLRVPAQQARIFNEDGGTGTYSRVEQALLDLKNDPKVTASMTPRQLTKMLEDRGVTKADLQEHGLNLTDYVRKNQHGHDVVDVQKVFDGIEPPQERMGRVILDETGGGDADEMDLRGRQNSGQLGIADFWEHEGQHRMDDWLYDYMNDIERDYSTLGRELSPNTFDRQGSQTDEILEAISDRLKARGEAQTDEEAVIMAYDKLNKAIDGGGDWLSDLDAELGGGIQNKAEETIISREQEFYNENPYIDDNIEFAGEDFDIFGNDDVGYTAHHNGTKIIDDVYSLDELEVRIQNWAMDRGYFGYGTGENAMQWSQYLAGDSDYFEPLEEVVLTYDTGTGRVYNPSHEHYGTDVADGYVVHMRTSSRETADGKSVYHVDEIQSDLHQDARNEGYISQDELNATNDSLDKARARVDEYETKENEVIRELYDSYVEGSYTPDFKRLKEIEPKAKAFFAEVLEAYKGDSHVGTMAMRKNLRDMLTINADPQLDFADLPSSMFRDHPEEFISNLFANRTSLAGKRAEKVKEIARKHFNDPEDKKAIEFYDGYANAQKKVTRLRKDLRKADASYPLKDNRWIKAMVRQAMERAVAKGNFDGITISNPNNPVKAGGAERFMELYKNVYGDRMEKIIKDIGKEYGVTPKKVKLNDPEMQKMGEQWYLPLTKDMIESIRGRGVPLASAAGATPAIFNQIDKERQKDEEKMPRIFRTA